MLRMERLYRLVDKPLAEWIKLLCLLSLTHSFSTAFAQEEFVPKICDETEVVRCSTDLEDVACLEMLHACGRYETIVRHFESQQVKSPEAMFYTGLSFYGLYNRSRIKSQQCEFVDAAQNLLTDFLADAKTKSQLRNQTVFRRSYWATRAMEDMKRIQGCQDKGVSKASLLAFGRDYADALIRKLFIMKADTSTALGKKINEVKDSIQTAVRGIASKAAEIEANLNLRRQALEASNNVIKDLITRYNDFFGTAKATSKTDRDYVSSIDLELKNNGTFLQAKQKATDYITEAKASESLINSKLGSISADAYARSRVGLSTMAADEISLDTGTNNTADDMNSTTFKEVVALSQTAQGNDKSQEILTKLQGQWSTLIACTTKPNQWQCLK